MEGVVWVDSELIACVEDAEDLAGWFAEFPDSKSELGWKGGEEWEGSGSDWISQYGWFAWGSLGLFHLSGNEVR
jgi:hypothetical protein